MISLDQPVTIIADVHGNDDSLHESLRRASGGGSDIDVPALGHVVFTGDLNDKWADQYVKILNRILKLQDETRVTLCMGNHESVMLQALHDGRFSHMKEMWTLNGGKKVLLEISKSREKIVDITKCDEDGDFKHAQKLFLAGEYYERIFMQMCLMETIAPHVRAVHAGMNEYYARMYPRQANDFLHACIQQKNLKALNYRDEISDILWMKEAHLLNPETAVALKEKDILVVVHGHKVLPDHRQSLHQQHGIAVMNGDIALGDKDNWGYIRIDDKGRFIAASKQGGERPFGELTDEGYLSPDPA